MLLPFFAILGSIIKNKNEYNIDLKNIMTNSIKLSFSVFLAYFLFYCIVIMICGGSYGTYISREIFLDILGRDFYSNHVYMYYLIDGLVRFLFAPFVYISGGMMLSECFRKRIWFYFSIIAFYFELSMISTFLTNSISNNFIYINPSSIIISGNYTNISTPLIILFNLFFLITILLIYVKKIGGKKSEKQFF